MAKFFNQGMHEGTLWIYSEITASQGLSAKIIGIIRTKKIFSRTSGQP
jgi:hypothetical protein